MDENLFICPHCHKNYNDSDRIPKIFPVCGHSFCSQCLSFLWQNQPTVICPLDQMFFTVPSGAKDPFPENIGLKGILKSLVCQERCKYHGKKLSLICFTDNQKICNHCVQYGAHKDHKLKPIKNIKTDAEKAAESLKVVSEKAGMYRNKIDKTFQEKGDYLTGLIRDKFRELRSAIEAKENQMLSSTRSFFSEGIGKVDGVFGAQSQLKKKVEEKSQSIKRVIDDQAQLDFDEEYPLMMAFDFATEFANQHVDYLMEKINETSGNLQTSLNDKIIQPLNSIGFPFEELQEEVKTAMGDTQNLLENEGDPLFPTYSSLFTLKQRDQSLAFSDKTEEKTPGKDSPLTSSHYQTIAMVGLKFLKNQLVGEALMAVLNIYRRLKMVKILKIDFSQRKVDHRELIGVYTLIWSMQNYIETYELLLEASQFEEKALISVFSGALSKLTNLKKITLDLRNTAISDTVVERLAEALGSLNTLEYLKLRLASTKIKDDSVTKLFSLKLPMLKWFIVNLNNTLVSDRSIEQLARDGLPGMKALEHLELRLSLTKVTDDGMSQFVRSNLLNLKSFSLGLNFTKVTSKTLEAFASETLGNMRNLESLELHLRCMQLKDESLIELFKHKLPKMRSLTLDISNNSIQDEGLKALGANLPQMKALDHLDLYLGTNDITDGGFSSLPLNQIGAIKSFSIQFEQTKISNKAVEQTLAFMKSRLNRQDVNQKGYRILTQVV